MAKGIRISIFLPPDEVAIADAVANRLGISRSEVFRHLILYQGMCGGDFPLTSKIIGLPERDRDRIVAELRRNAEAGRPVKPQSFRQWVTEALGSDDPDAMERGVEVLLRKLMEG